MARIRTVKPELWTDPDFIDLSLSARLLFIASLNFATDHGVLPDKPRQLKMQCLPADDMDAGVLIEELVRARFIERRIAPNGDKVLVIRTFAKNQKVNRPTDGRWGDPAKWGDSGPDCDCPHGGLTEDSQTEGKGRDNSEGTGSLPSSSMESRADPQPVDDDDFRAAIDILVDHRCAGRPIDNMRAYRPKVEDEAVRLDGEAIRSLIAEGYTPQGAVDRLLEVEVMHGTPKRSPIPWCGPDCDLCDGSAFVEADGGLAPCPNRKEVT